MVTITIPLPLPPAPLSPNARSHWRVKAKAIAEYRLRAAEEAQVAAYEADWDVLNLAIIEIRYYHKTKAFRDPDNIIAAMKSAIDGIVDAGILTDDRDVTYLPPVREKDKDNPRVELVVSEVTS